MKNHKSNIRKKLLIEGLLALSISLSVLFFYSYKYFPSDPEIEKMDLLSITITRNGYKSIFVAFYYYLGKIVPLYLLIIWFITCKHWWYHAILIPIAMYSFQFYTIVNEDASKIDENELLYLMGVCMVVIPIVYFIRVKLFDKHVHGIDLDAIDAELKEYKERERLQKEQDLKGKKL
ncbi:MULTISPECIES: hypothetical protein [Cellulophaga]|uniref:hypothetical protein n=2 Tax=Cellulophaga TaxID=104264 RepID=UPI0004103DF7|nr:MULTISPECIES: hypothetical protein [Cellulophaga]AIY14773.1 hypothetical protein M667_17245 [Cellulophaga baltica NN016038]MBA6315571.1 hypothetical protein [Cellulophaga baltica]QXP53361.1 hypothetical protein H0I24_05335 [Cellulophaga sp. HaHa_2_1]